MARSQAGESKAPIIIALAFFVLTTLGLGVLTYMAFSEKEGLLAAKKKAEDEQKNSLKLLTAEEEKKLLYKGAIGLLSPEEQAKLQNLREKEAVRTEYNEMVAAIDKRVRAVVDTKANEILTQAKGLPGSGFNMTTKQVFDWEWPADAALPVQPRVPLADQVVAFYAQQKLSGIEATIVSNAAKAAKDKFEDQTKSAATVAAQYQQALDKVPADTAALAKKYDAELAQVRKKYADETKEFNTFRQITDQRQNELSLEVRKVGEDLAKAKNLADSYREKLEVTQDQFAYDQPHGKILRRQKNDIVEINLGSADNVKSGLKFSVQPSDTPQRGFDSRRTRDGTITAKAQIEVIQTMGPHLSQARIIPGTEADKVRDGVLVGDLLYNSVWRKGEPDHVALFGIFDLNGDGTDDIKQLAKDLNRMGIVVDAYYDLDQKTWTGKLTEKTIYAVQGNTPFKEINAGEPPAVIAAKGEILKAIEDAGKDARNRGTKVVRMRDFFPRIGYPVNLDVEERRINSAAARYLKTDAPAVAPEN